MATVNKIGTRVRHDPPPPKPVLGLGAAILAINPLSVVLGNGVILEALAWGCLFVLLGLSVLVAGRSFDAVWSWVDRSGKRILVFVGLLLAVGCAAAEAVARIAYGQRLFG